MIIKVENVTFSYNSIKALDNVTLEFREGLLYGIIGPNGAGKTTFLKVLAKILEPATGVIYIDGRALKEYSRREIAKILSYASTEIPKGFNTTVLEFVLTSRYPHMKGFWETEEDLKVTKEALSKVEALHLVNRRLEQLSSGELQRVLIAKLLVQGAKILLVDEPTAHLDLKYRIEIMHLLKDLTKSRKMITIITLHDLMLAGLCDELILLDKGRVIAIGKPKDVLTRDNIMRSYKVLVEIIEHKRLGTIVIPIEPLR